MMKKYLVTISYLLIAVACFAQEIKFESLSGWQLLKDKAKEENKFIFLDVYATWCVPCQQMDKEVYSDTEVGKIVNSSFISAKVQWDRTDQDDEKVKAWYADAKAITTKYGIGAFPSYLFFNSEGNLIYQASGLKTKADFIALTDLVKSPETSSFLPGIANYKKGVKDYPNMPELIKKTKEVANERELAKLMSEDYVHNYLEQLSIDQQFKKDHFLFLSEHQVLFSSKSQYFKYVLNSPEKLNQLMDSKSFSKEMLSSVIQREEVLNKIFKDDRFKVPVTNRPNWVMISNTIARKYSKAYADELLPPLKHYFFNITGDWVNLAAMVDERIKKFPPVSSAGLGDLNGTFKLNSDAWNVFLYCENKMVLKKALGWVELAIKIRADVNEQYIDTKANLLYKLGRTEEAIKTEELAIETVRERLIKKGVKVEFDAKEYLDVIEKMKSGQITWKPRRP